MDLSFSDLVQFEDQYGKTSKVCVLNLEAFSVFLNQNKGNDEAIKKLFDDIISVNHILAGGG